MCDLCSADTNYEPDPLVRDDGASSVRMLAWVLWYVLAVVALAVALVGFLAAPARADDFDQAARIAYDNTRSFSTGRHTTDDRVDCTDAAYAAFLYLSDRGYRPAVGYCPVGSIHHVFVMLDDGRAIDVNHKRPVALGEIGCDRAPAITPWTRKLYGGVRKALPVGGV